ncbi:MAG: hypothetical protein RLN70_03965, partial [Rhodospirillaceae bacterium]
MNTVSDLHTALHARSNEDDVEAGEGHADALPSTDGSEIGGALETEAGDAPAEQEDGEQTESAAFDFSSACILLLESDSEVGERTKADLGRLGIDKIVWETTVETAYFQLTEDDELFPDVLILELALP